MPRKFLVFCIAILSVSYAKTQYNFTTVDNLLNANLSSVFHNKVICLVMHNDSLIYYYHQGGDSLTKGDIASATKTISAALMLRLAQEGTFGLDDSIAKYYPFATTLGKGAITIRQLFAHVSGIEGTTNYNSDAGINLQQSADSILTFDSLRYTPIGTKFCYTGEDQQIAGAAAELAAGMKWDTLFKVKIAQPLGLTNTTFAATTPSNPRIAGGIRTNISDMIRFGEFVLHNGKNYQGIQIIDSINMQELWSDQTNRAYQVYSPYPYQLLMNNPYNADTIYYGLGSWLDIWNPIHFYQEQISADGAFGGIIWINRCTNMVGAFLTFMPSVYSTTYPIEFQTMDIFRNAVPNTCYKSTQIIKIDNKNPIVNIFPNPAQSTLIISASEKIEKISIYDLLGENILNVSPGKNETSINIRSIPGGFYLVKINSGKNFIAKKILFAH
jgi:CubicO group peptidase (beta-lactamase class C family)